MKFLEKKSRGESCEEEKSRRKRRDKRVNEQKVRDKEGGTKTHVYE